MEINFALEVISNAAHQATTVVNGVKDIRELTLHVAACWAYTLCALHVRAVKCKVPVLYRFK